MARPNPTEVSQLLEEFMASPWGWGLARTGLAAPSFAQLGTTIKRGFYFVQCCSHKTSDFEQRTRDSPVSGHVR